MRVNHHQGGNVDMVGTPDLAAIIRRARRHDQHWDAAVVRNATAAQRQKLLGALVDGFGIEDTLRLLSRATTQLRASRRRLLARAS